MRLGFVAAGLAVLLTVGGTAQAAKSPAPSAEPNEAVWHLRAGLNVAALMCKGRGRVSVASPYSRLLKRHRDLLAAAYEAEERRQGRGMDRHMTKLYNRYSNQRSPETFCRKASDVAKEAVKMDSPTLAVQAKRLVSRL